MWSKSRSLQVMIECHLKIRQDPRFQQFIPRDRMFDPHMGNVPSNDRQAPKKRHTRTMSRLISKMWNEEWIYLTAGRSPILFSLDTCLSFVFIAWPSTSSTSLSRQEITILFPVLINFQIIIYFFIFNNVVSRLLGSSSIWWHSRVG